MLKKTITYKGFDGDATFTDDFYFHMSKAELVDLEASKQGGLEVWLRRIMETNDNAALWEEFKRLVLAAYGKRSDDGKRFIKTQQLREEFASTEAFSDLLVELVTDADKAAEFINGILPGDLAQQVEAMPRTHPSDTAGTPVSGPVSGRNVFENTAAPTVLSKKEALEMDAGELQAGLANGTLVIAQDQM